MPYNPGIEYHGDQYVAQGISSFGRNIGEGISEWKKKHDELAQALGESDTIVNHALKSKTMSPEQYTEYLGASAKQKEGIAAGIAKNQALDIADKQFEEQKKFQYAQLANAMKIAQMHIAAQGAGGDAALSPEQFAQMQQAGWKAGYETVGIPTKGGGIKPQFLPYHNDGGGDKPVNIDKIKAVEIPGSGGLKMVVDENGNMVNNNQIQGAVRPNPIMSMFPNMFGGQGATGAGGGGGGGPQPQQYKKGQRLKQDGDTYEFDGTNWNKVQ